MNEYEDQCHAWKDLSSSQEKQEHINIFIEMHVLAYGNGLNNRIIHNNIVHSFTI